MDANNLVQNLAREHPHLSYNELLALFNRYTYKNNKLEYHPLLNENLDGEGLYQDALNKYRSNYCDGKSRQLLDGEKHIACHNFSGPGTRIDLQEVANVQPYNNIDACSKAHDLEYLHAFENLKGQEKERAIREADIKAVQCYDKHKNESGYRLAKSGISGKMLAEDKFPIATKFLAPNYFGSGRY